jgi:hypothetical protein
MHYFDEKRPNGAQASWRCTKKCFREKDSAAFELINKEKIKGSDLYSGLFCFYTFAQRYYATRKKIDARIK